MVLILAGMDQICSRCVLRAKKSCPGVWLIPFQGKKLIFQRVQNVKLPEEDTVVKNWLKFKIKSAQFIGG